MPRRAGWEEEVFVGSGETAWRVSTWLRDEQRAETARRLWKRAGLTDPRVEWVEEHRLWRLTATAVGPYPGGIADTALVGVPHTGLGIVPAGEGDAQEDDADR
jgi:hypothetical protein